MASKTPAGPPDEMDFEAVKAHLRALPVADRKALLADLSYDLTRKTARPHAFSPFEDDVWQALTSELTEAGCFVQHDRTHFLETFRMTLMRVRAKTCGCIWKPLAE